MRPVWLLLYALLLLLFGGCDDVPIHLTTKLPPQNALLLLDAQTEQVVVKTGLTGFADPAQQLTLDEVICQPQRGAFAPVSSPVAIGGPSAYFLRLSLRNTGVQPLPVLLEIDHPFLEELTATLVPEQGLPTRFGPVSQRTPQAQRPFYYRNFVLPLSLPPGQISTLWMRLMKSPGSHAFPLRLWQPAAFTRHTVVDTGFWSVLIGWLLFAFVLSGLLAIGTTDSVYWLYGLYVLAHLVTICVHEGLFSDVYASGVPGLAADYVGDVAIGLVTGSTILFIRALLNSQQYAPRWLLVTIRLWLVVWLGWLAGYVLDSLGQPTHAVSRAGQVLYSAKLLVHQTDGVLVMLLIGYGLAQRSYRRLAQTYMLALVPLFTLALFDFYANLSPIPVVLLMQTPIYAGAILFETLVLTYGLVYRFRTYRNEHERLLREQNELTLHTQLAERERLARDLHDHISPDLVVLKMQLEAVNEAELYAPDGVATQQVISNVIQHAERIIFDLRQVSHALMPLALEKLGLIGALDVFIGQLNQGAHHPEINFTHDLPDPLSNQQRQYLLQIAKELINNALRHAHTSLIDVEVHQLQQRVELTVSDNGVGYVPGKRRTPAAGIGLRNIHDLTQGLGGRLEVWVKPTGGMIHRVSVPV